MHALISRFLDLAVAASTLEAAAPPSDPDAAAWLAEANREPKFKDALARAKGKTPSPNLQQQAIVIAVRAATARLLDDPSLGPAAKGAIVALETEGASTEEARSLLSGVLLEEAFGYAEDPDHFDIAFVAETLASLHALAKVTADVVDDWLERFAKAGGADGKALRLSVAETLLDAAWSEGPQPIGPEHLDDALQTIADAVAESEFPKAVDAVSAFLALLATEKIVGVERLARLGAILESAKLSGEASPDGDEEEDEDDEGDDEES
jgi:hypothetical protein